MSALSSANEIYAKVHTWPYIHRFVYTDVCIIEGICIFKQAHKQSDKHFDYSRWVVQEETELPTSQIGRQEN